MSTVRELLAEAVQNAARVAVLGCGSPLLGDDAAGHLIAERLTGFDGNTRAFCGSTAPENFTGEIKNFRPDVLLVIDAADMSLPAGQAAFIPPEEIKGASFSTHMLPLHIMLDYLRQETGCRVFLLGIQAVSLEFGSNMTPEVQATVKEVAKALLELRSDT